MNRGKYLIQIASALIYVNAPSLGQSAIRIRETFVRVSR